MPPMMDVIRNIRQRVMNEKVRDKVQKILGCPVVEVRKFENETNNYVYSVVTAKQRYIYKQYRDKNWPEDCKVPFVHKVLEQNHIPKASLIQYCKQDVEFPNGFLLETEVRGVCANKTTLRKEQEEELFAKLGMLVSKVHNIQFQKFGYIGDGCPHYDSLESFFKDDIDDTVKPLVVMNLYTKGEIEMMKTRSSNLKGICRFTTSIMSWGSFNEKHNNTGEWRPGINRLG